MDTLDLRTSPSPMEGVMSNNDENIKLASSSAKYKLQRDKERYVVEDYDGEEEEEEDDDDDEDEELDAEDEEDDEYFEQSQDEESFESPSSKPSSSAACRRKSKSLTKSSDGPGPSSSIPLLKNPDHQWSPNTQPLKNQIDENKAHQIRMKNLRKHIDYIEQTNWLYTPIEELIGHTDSSNK